MDIFISLFCLSLSVLIIAACYLAKLRRDRRLAIKRITDVRNRALARVTERQFADTEIGNDRDPYNMSIEYETAMSVVEIDDKFDGRGNLTKDQLSIIKSIFNEFDPIGEQLEEYETDTLSHRRAGVPFSNSIFSDNNTVEIIMPEFKEANVI